MESSVLGMDQKVRRRHVSRMLYVPLIAAGLALAACQPPKGTVAHAMQGETLEEKCKRLHYLSDERTHWETRRKALVKAAEIGCLKWSE